MAYKYILFDLDHTLWDFPTSEDIALTQLLEELGVEDIPAYKEYYVHMNRALWDDLDRKKITKQELIDTRFSRLFQHFGIEVDGPVLAKRYQDFISQQGQHYTGADDLLAKLVQDGYVLIGATNGVTYIQKGRLAVSDLTKYFTEVYISDEIGHHKPEVEFFSYIFKEHPEMKKEQTLMVGDNLIADIGGANQFGIDSVWYNPFHKDLSDESQPTIEVSNYDELYDFIKSKE